MAWDGVRSASLGMRTAGQAVDGGRRTQAVPLTGSILYTIDHPPLGCLRNPGRQRTRDLVSCHQPNRRTEHCFREPSGCNRRSLGSFAQSPPTTFPMAEVVAVAYVLDASLALASEWRQALAEYILPLLQRLGELHTNPHVRASIPSLRLGCAHISPVVPPGGSYLRTC